MAISVISWQSVLKMEETEENHRHATSCFQTLSHNVVWSTWGGFEITTLVVIDTNCTGSCKFNHHTILTMTAPHTHTLEGSTFKIKILFELWLLEWRFWLNYDYHLDSVKLLKTVFWSTTAKPNYVMGLLMPNTPPSKHLGYGKGEKDLSYSKDFYAK